MDFLKILNKKLSSIWAVKLKVGKMDLKCKTGLNM